MNLPLQYDLNNIQPMHSKLHGVFDNILSLTTGLCESKMSFILLWKEEFHTIHHHSHGIKAFHTTNFNTYKERFSQVKAPCFYAPNTKYHTLFQDLYFFKLFELYAKVLIAPIFDQHEQMCGLIGVLHPETPTSVEQNKHALKEMSRHASLELSRNKIKETDIQPKPVLLQSLSQLPGAHYEFIINQEGQMGYPSVSQELINLHPHFWGVEHSNNPESAFKLLHQVEFCDFKKFLLNKEENKPIEFSYALKGNNEATRHYLVRINTYLNDSGETLCFGAVRDISLHKDYETILDQIIFDISHVMRRPVATMQGLTQLIELDKMNKETVREVASKLQLVSNEMDTYIKKLYRTYHQKWEQLEASENK